MIFLKIGNTKKTIAEWGCESPTLTFNSFSADEFSFTTSLLNFRTAWMDFETPLEIYQDSTRVFVGYVQEPTVVKSGVGDNVQVSAKGLWDVFESTYYKNSWHPWYVSGTISAIQDATKTQIFGRRQDIGYGSTSGSYILDDPVFINNWSAQDFFTEEIIPAFANTSNASLFDIPAANIDFNSDLILPFEEKDNPTYADVFQSITKWHPELLSWFDYSGVRPSLSIKSGDICDILNIDISDTSEVSLTKDIKRHRNVILRVVKYIKGKNAASWRYNKGYVDYKDEGVSDLQRNVMVVPIDACGDNYINNTFDAAGLHARLKAIVNVEDYTGSVSLYDRKLSNRYVGKRLNIKNSRENLDNIDAKIQSDSIDLMSGTRQLTLGSDNQPDCSDFVSRIEWLMGEKKSFPYLSKLLQS